MRSDVAAWLARTRADAEARGLTALAPLLEGLARSTSTLRDADPALTAAAGPEGPVYGQADGEASDAAPESPAGTSDASDAAR